MLGALATIAGNVLPKVISFVSKKLGNSNIGHAAAKTMKLVTHPNTKKFMNKVK